MSEPIPGEYFSDYNQTVSGLRERIDPVPEIKRVVDTFLGIERDSLGKEIPQVKDKEGNVIGGSRAFPVMNAEGCSRTRGFLYGMVTKITHLSKYQNEDRINRQVRHFVKQWLYVLIKNRKKWGITDREIVLSEVENLIYESKTRAVGGFEANLTGKAHQVSEIISSSESTSKPRMGFMKRNNRNEEVY